MIMNVQFNAQLRAMAPYATAMQFKHAEEAQAVTFGATSRGYAGFTAKEVKAAAAEYRSHYKNSHLDDAYVFDGRLADSITKRRPAYISPRELALVAVWMLPSKVLGQDHTNMLKGFAQHSDEQIIDITKRALKALKQENPMGFDLFGRNPIPRDIAAIQQGDPVKAINILKEISGVDTTFATVLLSVVKPDTYVPMAGRVLDLLEQRDTGKVLSLPKRPDGVGTRQFVKDTPEAYPAYLAAVTQVASQLKIPLVDFDRGAWTMAAQLPKS